MQPNVKSSKPTGPSAASTTNHALQVTTQLEYVLITLIVLIPRVAGLYSIDLFDDAFITFRYAENLARGNGFVYNPGVFALGTTTPLFGLILTIPCFLGVSAPTAAVFISVASDLVTGHVAYRLLSTSLGRYAALGAVTAFALDPHSIRIGVGGMESSLFLALSVLIILLLTQQRYTLAVALASASVYIRPEAALLLMISVVLTLRAGLNNKAVKSLSLGAAIVLVPLFFMYQYYGTILPQSLISKSSVEGATGIGVLLFFFFPRGSLVQTLYTLMAPVGVALATRKSKFATILLVWASLYVTAYVLGSPGMFRWYGLPVYFAKAVFAGIALSLIVPEVARSSKSFLKYSLAAATSLSFVVALSMYLVVGASPVRRNVYEPLRIWCTENTNQKTTIAAGDIGAIGYYSDAFIYDLAGLVWPGRHDYGSHLEIVDVKKPDFIFAEFAEYWRELFDPRSDLRRTYKPVKRFSRNGERSLTAPLEDLAGGWQKDSVLFERVRE